MLGLVGVKGNDRVGEVWAQRRVEGVVVGGDGFVVPKAEVFQVEEEGSQVIYKDLFQTDQTLAQC